jgi:hypothetical protein
MACEIVRIEGAVLYARITGVMKLADQEILQKAGMGLVAGGRKLRLHVTLEGFQGWEKGVDWGDVDFLMAHGDDIARIAIVGDARWKDQTFAFVGKGFRSTEVEFFPPSSAKEAEEWVQR